MMKQLVVLVAFLLGAVPLWAQAADDALHCATADLDMAQVKQALATSGTNSTDADEICKHLQDIQKQHPGGDMPMAPVTDKQAHEAAQALANELAKRNVSPRLVQAAIWAVQDRRFPRVDPTPLFAQLKSMSLDPASVKALTDTKIHVYAKDRTDVAEAQYDPITKSLYLPPDYLEPGAKPPRLKTKLSSVEINTVVHELDHAEKNQLYDDSEVYGKTLGGAMLAGVRKVGLAAVGTGFAALAISAIPKLAVIAPQVGLVAMGALVVGGAAYGAYQWYTSRDKNPRTAQQQAAKDAVDGIAKVIRSTPSQREVLGLTEARGKAWEVSGYFVGDSMTEIYDQIDSLKLEQLRRIRAAKTRADVEAVLTDITVSPQLGSHTFGDAKNAGGAFFRVKEVNFPYKEHPELFTQLYQNSLGLNPPKDVNDLVRRINADPSTFPDMRTYLRGAADRREKELEAGPNFNDVRVGQ